MAARHPRCGDPGLRKPNKKPRPQPRVVAGGYRQRLGLWRYQVHLTDAEHAALVSFAGSVPRGEQAVGDGLGSLIGEALADGLVDEEGSP